MDEIEALSARLERVEAAAIAHAAVLAAVIAHHPAKEAVQASIEKMTEAATTALLFQSAPDALQRHVALAVARVNQLSTAYGPQPSAD